VVSACSARAHESDAHVLRSYENNNVGSMAWNILKISPEMAELILARFLEWVLKVNCAITLIFLYFHSM
jgi:hypothetical protein